MNNGSGGRGCAYEQQRYPNECGIVVAGSGQVGVRRPAEWIARLYIAAPCRYEANRRNIMANRAFFMLRSALIVSRRGVYYPAAFRMRRLAAFYNRAAACVCAVLPMVCLIELPAF